MTTIDDQVHGPSQQVPGPDQQAAVLIQQAMAYYRVEDDDRAAELAQRALVIDPSNPDALYLLGMVHHRLKAHSMAVQLLKRSAAIDKHGEVLHNLGLVHVSLGQLTEGIVAYREAIRLEPADFSIWANLIFALDLHPHAAPELLMAERRAINDTLAAPLTRAASPHTNIPDPERRLRIGYVSGDFRHHSASGSFSPVINHTDPKNFKLYLYSTSHPSKADQFTAAYERRADVWSDVHGLADAQLSEQIRRDQIDVLVDLSAYSRDGRLLTFARRPAPIQISGWGYATGTGLDCMDYLVSDSITIPPELEHLYTERIMRLPCLVAYSPGTNYPDVTPEPPLVKNGYVTFGYLGRPIKLNDGVMAAWAEIMRQVPGSKLLMKADDFRESDVRDRVIDPLVALGIEPSRVRLKPTTDQWEHLNTYNEVDVALDSWPAGGGATVLEACLMGVPTVTKLGRWVSERQSAAIIHHVDIPPTEDLEQYIFAAFKLANDPDQLAVWRRTLRQKLLASPVCDGPKYAQMWERRVREAWRAWCRAQRTRTTAA